MEDKDYYSTHLASVNETNAVLTTNDIYNADGAILVPKGTPITPEVSNQIIRHRLLEPLENSISLQNPIQIQAVFDSVHSTPTNEKALRFNNKDSIQSILTRACENFSKFPILVNKLTVMSNSLPVLYEKTILCTYISLSIAQQMKLDENQINIVFFATLMKDIGLLHIDPDLLNKKGGLTPEEWRTLKSHSTIGKVFLDLVPSLPKAVSRAVYEHHERTDGSGYPQRKMAEDLCIEGQIVAMSDTITAIYYKQVVEKGYTVAAIIPVLQVNSTLHFYQTYRAVIQLLHDLSISKNRVYQDGEVIELAKKMHKHNIQLKQWFDLAIDITVFCSEHLSEKKSRVIMAFYKRIQTIISTSGLLTKNHLQWLESVIAADSDEDYVEVEHIALMLDELEWQCLQWQKSLVSIIEAYPGMISKGDWDDPIQQLSTLFSYDSDKSIEVIEYEEVIQK